MRKVKARKKEKLQFCCIDLNTVVKVQRRMLFKTYSEQLPELGFMKGVANYVHGNWLTGSGK